MVITVIKFQTYFFFQYTDTASLSFLDCKWWFAYNVIGCWRYNTKEYCSIQPAWVTDIVCLIARDWLQTKNCSTYPRDWGKGRSTSSSNIRAQWFPSGKNEYFEWCGSTSSVDSSRISPQIALFVYFVSAFRICYNRQDSSWYLY